MEMRIRPKFVLGPREESWNNRANRANRAVDLVVRAHERGDARTGRRFKWRIVELEASALICVVGDVGPEGLLIVEDPVLRVGHHARRLDAADGGRTKGE